MKKRLPIGLSIVIVAGVLGGIFNIPKPLHFLFGSLVGVWILSEE